MCSNHCVLKWTLPLNVRILERADEHSYSDYEVTVDVQRKVEYLTEE
jgi:hypothetical protein